MSSLQTLAVDTFGPGFSGTLMFPTDPEYDRVRAIWNATIDRRPAVIARCANADDVARAIAFARSHDLEIAIRGGGHNIAGNAVCEGGMMIDLSLMQAVRVDPILQRAHVEPGVTLGMLDQACQKHGLATSVGVNSTTGIAGLTLGGGFGWLTRKYGLTVDNLLSAKVITADGELLEASERTNPDLFWALRGGGGNFGVVTEFEFQLHPVGPQVYAGIVAFPARQALRVLRNFRAHSEICSEEFMMMAVLRKAPPLPFLPEAAHGTDVILVPSCYVGDVKAGPRQTAPLLSFGDPLGSQFGMTPFVEWQTVFDPLLTPGARNYWKTHNFTSMPDEAFEVILKHAQAMPTGPCEVFIPHLGGAANRVPADAMAYPSRDTNYVMNIHARWESADDDQKCIAWARGLFADMIPYASTGAYVNFMTEDEGSRVESAYGANYKRLAAIKKRYDPNNLFHFNQNIKPT